MTRQSGATRARDHTDRDYIKSDTEATVVHRHWASRIIPHQDDTLVEVWVKSDMSDGTSASDCLYRKLYAGHPADAMDAGLQILSQVARSCIADLSVKTGRYPPNPCPMPMGEAAPPPRPAATSTVDTPTE
jgi:hypothetical protein